MKDRLKMKIGFDVRKNGYFFQRVGAAVSAGAVDGEGDCVVVRGPKGGWRSIRDGAPARCWESAFRKMTAQLDDSVRFFVGEPG